MTAAVWLAPLVPKLPLPLAQRVERLLTATPGRATELHALSLCEAILAYAACLRASVAAAVVPDDERETLMRGLGEFRRTVSARPARARDFAGLLVAASTAIEEIEEGHPLGRSELTCPLSGWNGPRLLSEALADEPGILADEREAAVAGGLAGLLALWVTLIERFGRGLDEIDAATPAPEPSPWLAPLGDSIVEVLGSSLLAGAELATLDPTPAGPKVRRLHGLAAVELDREGELGGEIEGGRGVCWRFPEQEISSHGLLHHWVDEHEFDHVGIISSDRSSAKYLDYGTGRRSPSKPAAVVDWRSLGLPEVAQAKPAAVVVEESRSSSIAALAGAVLVIALILAGVSWALWPTPAPESAAAATGPSASLEPSASPAPEPVAEIVVAAAADTEGEPARRSASPESVDETGDETGGDETGDDEDVALASVWFESERNLGTCKVSYEGQTRTANLHLKTRQPEGELEFSYRCGEYRGRGTIAVARNRVNGVLFCKQDGAVRVKTVRTKEGRCDG